MNAGTAFKRDLVLAATVVILALFSVGFGYAVYLRGGVATTSIWDILFVLSAIGFAVVFCRLLAQKASESFSSHQQHGAAGGGRPVLGGSPAAFPAAPDPIGGTDGARTPAPGVTTHSSPHHPPITPPDNTPL